MPPKKLLCIVTGMHRSGTTWLGQCLSSLDDVYVMDEPFNVNFGVRGTPHWYIDHRIEDDVAFIRTKLPEITSGALRFRRPYRSQAPLRSLLNSLRGWKTERTYRSFMKSDLQTMALKDPFLLMMLPELVAQDIPAIVSVRHPAAILLSLRRMNWHIPNEHLEGRRVAFHKDLRPDSDIDAICSFWAGVYQPLIQHLRAQGPKGLYIAFHETMFNDIELLSDSLIRFLDIQDEAAMASLQAFVRSSTSSNTVNPTHNRQHDLSRDSKSLSQSWVQKFDAAELARFEELIGEDYAFLKEMAAQSHP